MENPVLQIKDALIRVLKKIDPDTDVFFEEIKSTDPAHGVEQPKTLVFCGFEARESCNCGWDLHGHERHGGCYLP